MFAQSLCQYRIATLKIPFSIGLIINFEKEVTLEFNTLKLFNILDILFLTAAKVGSLLDCKNHTQLFWCFLCSLWAKSLKWFSSLLPKTSLQHYEFLPIPLSFTKRHWWILSFHFLIGFSLAKQLWRKVALSQSGLRCTGLFSKSL